MSDNFLLDLDNLEPEKKKDDESKNDNIQSMTEVGGDLVLSQTAKREPVKGPKSLSDLAQQFLKLIFTVDISGSMDGHLLPDNPRTLYKWTEENMAKIAAAIVESQTALSNEVAEVEEAEEVPDVNDPEALLAQLFGAAQSSMNPQVAIAALAGFTHNQDLLQDAVVMLGLTQMFGVKEDYSKFRGLETKMQALKKHIKKAIEERYNKYENPDIRLIEFDHNVHVKGAHTRDTLLNALNLMSPQGGTDIFPAVKASIELCQKAPSPLRAHHVVLVTDGMSHDAISLPTLIPTMKEMNIVLDVILLVSSADTSLFGADPMHKAIEETCKATGGEFMRVMRAKDFEQKFLAAASRLCLPAPPTKA